MKYEVISTTRFKKNYKAMQKRGYNMNELHSVIDMLRKGETLAPKFCDHQLTGDMSLYRECHIRPNWLLVYRIDEEVLVLTLTRTGTHSDLFG